jgi:hypothetical protein
MTIIRQVTGIASAEAVFNQAQNAMQISRYKTPMQFQILSCRKAFVKRHGTLARAT